MSFQSVLFSMGERMLVATDCILNVYLSKRCMDLAVRTICPVRLSKQLLVISYIEEVAG